MQFISSDKIHPSKSSGDRKEDYQPACQSPDPRHRNGRNIQYAELSNRATSIVGPKCGHIGKRAGSKDIDDVGEATRVLRKSKPTKKEWRHTLGRLTQEHTLLKEW